MIGWTAANASVRSPRPIDGYVHAEESSLAADNDNDDVTAIDGTRFADAADHPGTLTLTAGRYSLDELNLEGRTLRLDVSDGDVRLAVDGDLALAGDDVEVVGDGGSVRLFVTRDVRVTGESTVDIDGDVASRLWVYGTRDATIEVSNSEFVGVLYAPSDSTGSGTVRVDAGGSVKGAVVGGQTTLRSGGTVHFDTALSGVDPLFDADVPRVTFLHVTGTPVTVDRR